MSARVLATDLKGHKLPILIAITRGSTHEYLENCNEDGSFRSPVYPDDCIINVPQKRVVYINAYDNGVVRVCATRVVADTYGGKNRLACIRVEWQEGQFDE